MYAETIGYTPGQPYDVDASESESVKMLSAAAKEEGVWLLGGTLSDWLSAWAGKLKSCRFYPRARGGDW